MALNRFMVSVLCVAFFFVGSIAISSSASSSSDESGGESELPKSKEFVVSLDHNNFTDFVGRHKFIVVEFYAPWCGVCKKLAPEYEKAAEILSKEDPPLILAKVDANEEINKILAHEFEVSGYPTIKILRYGGSVVHDFKGPREADGIAAYVKKENGPATAELKSAEEVVTLVDDKKIVIVGIFPEFSGEKFENFTTLAERLRSEYEIRHTLDANLLPHGDSSVPGPVIRLFKPFDELYLDFQDFDVDSLEKLIQESSIATVTFFDKDGRNHPYVVRFFNGQDDKAMMFINTSSEIYDSFKEKYYEVAKEYKGKGISFLIGDVEASHGAFQFFGLKEDQVPLIIVQTNDGSKYVKPKVEPDQISLWVKEFKDGKLQPFKKSEPVPESNNEPVKVVVADTFDDMVFNSGKNVLLEFYAPWCGHCKKLAPILDEVAVTFANDDDVLIAKIDATSNDIVQDTFEVKGYPTLYFKSASGKVLAYDGERSKDDMVSFIKKNRDKARPQPQPQPQSVQTESRKEEL